MECDWLAALVSSPANAIHLFLSQKIINYTKTNHHKAMKKNLYTPDYIPDNVCKYDVYAMLSFGGVCGITH